MGVGTYGKIHCKCGTAYSMIVDWFLAMVNDQITTNRYFLGNSEALSSNLKSFWFKKSIENRCTEKSLDDLTAKLR